MIFGFRFSKFRFYVFEIMSFLYNMAKYEEYALTKYNKMSYFENIKPKIKKIRMLRIVKYISWAVGTG